MHPELRAVKDQSLEFQNYVAEAYGLPRAITSEDYVQMVNDDYLVNVPKRIKCISIDPRLKGQLVTLTPTAISYITNHLASEFCAKEDGRSAPTLVISSLVRTLAYQHILAKRNRNAAAALGDDNPYRRSSHSTGLTFDISTRNLSLEQRISLGTFLLSEKAKGELVEAIFEPGQNHFHVMVWPN